MYIFWFLHQTTTNSWFFNAKSSCISFDSYIKPQPSVMSEEYSVGCISFDSYIKPQLPSVRGGFNCVVYLLIPTSNHNSCGVLMPVQYVVYLLIPTSNHNRLSKGIFPKRLYIFWFLHQTTTDSDNNFKGNSLYIFWFLHQTTTANTSKSKAESCISFDSYIKPQLPIWPYFIICVVYLLIPTSNHN